MCVFSCGWFSTSNTHTVIQIPNKNNYNNKFWPDNKEESINLSTKTKIF